MPEEELLLLPLFPPIMVCGGIFCGDSDLIPDSGSLAWMSPTEVCCGCIERGVEGWTGRGDEEVEGVMAEEGMEDPF